MTNPPLPQPSEPVCPKCGKPASDDKSHGPYRDRLCKESIVSIYRHALTEMIKERDALVNAKVQLEAKVYALREERHNLGVIAREQLDLHQSAEAARDALRAENAKLTRENEDLVGVVETYGRLDFFPLEDRDELELRYRVSGVVFRAGGMTVFAHAIRECADRWEEKLRALRRAGMSTTERFLEAFADTERAQRHAKASLPNSRGK